MTALPEGPTAQPLDVDDIFREGISQRRLDSYVLRSFEEVALLIAITAFDLDTVKLLMNIFVSSRRIFQRLDTCPYILSGRKRVGGYQLRRGKQRPFLETARNFGSQSGVVTSSPGFGDTSRWVFLLSLSSAHAPRGAVEGG